MGSKDLGRIGLGVLLAGLLSLVGGQVLAAQDTAMTPEVAAKVETVRKQQDQRITPEKRKAAAQALKAERLKVYQASQEAKGQPAQGPAQGK